MNKWFQDGQPSSYKIQVMYVDIPEHLRLKKKAVDAPFRFRTFEEAQRASLDIFNGYEVQIVGSGDKPHWQEPDARMSKAELQKENWYDVYGVTPAYQTQYKREKQVQVQSSENESTFKDLQKLKPMIVPRNGVQTQAQLPPQYNVPAPPPPQYQSQAPPPPQYQPQRKQQNRA